jgi:hypothetical protein
MRDHFFFAALLASASWASIVAPGQESLTNRDERVLSAVLEHTIRPHVTAVVSGMGIRGVPPLLVLDETMTLCRSQQGPPPCVRPDDIATLRRPDRSGSLLGGSGYSGALRSELVDAFNLRNAVSQRFPRLNQSDVVLIPSVDLTETLKQWQGKTRGHLVFSSPGYSTDGHAVVIGSYVCGLCGRGWLFVLEQTVDQWRVIGAYGLWQS